MAGKLSPEDVVKIKESLVLIQSDSDSVLVEIDERLEGIARQIGLFEDERAVLNEKKVEHVKKTKALKDAMDNLG